ncbi:putative hydrolase [Pirellula sp. SH-Sr6A]|uniref:HD domain-containing protein n=1 Tax=Pirellula sp. SH-Sr6A TaxID=1632865 RepID=UPI00078DEDDC|nr:HD domain-containing protein [Pirellula sp. SH-Sr6A]AMV33224.1 putative hydrolase [Pirellula sp. SH-Sr6A]
MTSPENPLYSDAWSSQWSATILPWIRTRMAHADAGHGIDHVQRVVQNAIAIGASEGAEVNIVLPAAWLHDCVMVPKNSPERSKASRLAAAAALEFLHSIRYPVEWLEPIEHCIAAHSFSAGIPCESLEAKVVQDADRLEAIGAIGISRCLMTGGSMRQLLYCADQPFPIDRPPQDTVQSIDHFFAKLLGLAKTMQTDQGRRIASQRTEFMIDFLRQLASEIGVVPADLDRAISKASLR